MKIEVELYYDSELEHNMLAVNVQGAGMEAMHPYTTAEDIGRTVADFLSRNYPDAVKNGGATVADFDDDDAEDLDIFMPVIGTCTYDDSTVINIHDVDYEGDWVVASINDGEAQTCAMIANGADPDENGDPTMGFCIGKYWIPYKAVKFI